MLLFIIILLWFYFSWWVWQVILRQLPSDPEIRPAPAPKLPSSATSESGKADGKKEGKATSKLQIGRSVFQATSYFLGTLGLLLSAFYGTKEHALYGRCSPANNSGGSFWGTFWEISRQGGWLTICGLALWLVVMLSNEKLSTKREQTIVGMVFWALLVGLEIGIVLALYVTSFRAFI